MCHVSFQYRIGTRAIVEATVWQICLDVLLIDGWQD